MSIKYSRFSSLPSSPYLSEKSLWIRKRSTRRELIDPVEIIDEDISRDARAQAEGLVSTPYGKRTVREYMRQRFGEEGMIYSKDMDLRDDSDYIMSLLAVRKSYYSGN